jgi:hypothetical protein
MSSMWSSKAGQVPSVVSKDDLFEGVKDDEEHSINQSNLSAHYKIILKSATYQWFLMSLKRESIFQLGTSQPRIRQSILDKLPTEKFSKRRAPNVHEVFFRLEWQKPMEERLQYEFSEVLKCPGRFSRESIVTTGSPQEAQGLTMRQYLVQIWPANGLKLSNTPQTAIVNFDQRFYGKSANYMRFSAMLIRTQ